MPFVFLLSNINKFRNHCCLVTDIICSSVIDSPKTLYYISEIRYTLSKTRG